MLGLVLGQFVPRLLEFGKGSFGLALLIFPLSALFWGCGRADWLEAVHQRLSAFGGALPALDGALEFFTFLTHYDILAPRPVPSVTVTSITFITKSLFPHRNKR